MTKSLNTNELPGCGLTNGSRALAAVVLLSLVASLPGAAAGVDSDDFTLHVDLASDYVLRGYSQTRGRPAIQLSLDFEHESGIFTGLRLSNVDFASVGQFEDSRDLEVNIYAGYGRELSREWVFSATLVQYEYPGDDGMIDWDYTELGLALQRGAAALAVVYSDSAIGSGDHGLAVELTDRWRLPKDLQLAAGVGFFDLHAPFLKDYLYWNLGLSRPIRRFTYTLGYFDSDDRAEYLWGEQAEARLVAEVSYRLH